MSMYDGFSALIKGQPGAPTFRGYNSSAYFGKGLKGAGGQRMMEGDERLHQGVMDNMNRTPGYLEKDLKAMYDRPAEQSRRAESSNLARMNQNAAASGSFGSGKTARGRGMIMAEGSRTRADLQRQTRVHAAEAALRDRYNQLGTLSSYVNPRLQMSEQDNAQRNNFSMGMNQLDMQKWQAETAQYNKNFDWGWGTATDAASMGMACWVARAIYGEDNPKWKLARHFVLNLAPDWFRRLYVRYGESFGAVVRRSRSLRWLLRPFFDRMVACAEADLRRAWVV